MSARYQIPQRLSLGIGPTIEVFWVGIRQMRIDSECKPDDPTPRGLWDATDDERPRILLLSRLSRAEALDAYFHELQHALADVSYWVRHA